MRSFPEERLVDAGGVRLAVHEQGQGLPVVLVHGWPEIAYSWKNQIPALAAAGYRAIAPDLKGFGASDAPRDPAAYDIISMTGDLARLLDALSIDQAVFCGHDWGGAIVWPMAQLHPDRVLGVIGVCTPHRAAPPAPPLSIIRKRFGEKHYFLTFQEGGFAESVFQADPERFFRLMFRRPPTRAEIVKHGGRMFDLVGRFRDGPAPTPEGVIISLEDLAVYVEAYRRSGFHGGVNLYRNVDRNYTIMKDRDPVIGKPALWIGAANDAFLPPEGAEGMESIVPDLEKAIIADCGHWVMWEQPEALNQLLNDWLLRRFPAHSSKN